MHPALRVVLAVVGAALGANLSSSGSTLLGSALGALAGLGLGEAITLRVAIQKLRAELADLRTEELTRQAQKEALTRSTPSPQRTSPVTPPAPSAAIPPRPTYTAEQRPAVSAFESTPLAAQSGWTRPNPIEPPKSGGENPLIRMLREYFTGGNALVRGGVVVLFFGVAFLLRYLAEHSRICRSNSVFRASPVALSCFLSWAGGSG